MSYVAMNAKGELLELGHGIMVTLPWPVHTI